MTKFRKFSNDLKIERAEAFEDGKAILEGYFITYNSPAPCKPFDYYEQIAPKAVENSLKNNDVRCLFNHNTDVVLGRTSNNTLKLENRPNGLYGICELNLEDSQAKDIYARVKRGDISGCSFGAWIDFESEEYDEKRNLFTINDIDLVEVSVCSFPFYESTTMEARSRTEAKEKTKKKEIERIKKNFYKKQGEKKKWL